jgi:ORF6N domain
MMASKRHVVVPFKRIEQAIVRLRGYNVLLDADLGALYQVSVKALNQAVKRNRNRFPQDFMFRLSAEEAESLRSQNVTLESGRGQHRKYLPNVFTEQGVAMLSSVLRSQRAVRVNIEIMRAVVRLRQLIASNAESRRSSMISKQNMTRSSSWSFRRFESS